MSSKRAKLNSRGTFSPPRSMTATLPRSRSRGIRSPRFWKLDIAPRSPLRRRGWGSEIGAAARGEELAGLVEHLRLGGRELAAHAHHLAAHGEVAGHGRAVIVDA